jgi:hypothetical protein
MQESLGLAGFALRVLLTAPSREFHGRCRSIPGKRIGREFEIELPQTGGRLRPDQEPTACCPVYLSHEIPSRSGRKSNPRWKAMGSIILSLGAVVILAAQPLRAQGVNDYTGPVPRYQTQQPLPSNTTPPTVNRQFNRFSPGVPPPRARSVYRVRRG